MNGRTDLALEAAPDGGDGVEQTVREQDGVRLTHTWVRTCEASARMAKPMGHYVTAEVPPLSEREERLEQQARVIARSLGPMLPAQGTVLVVGLGNEHITPDALGPQAADMVLATRHISGEWARSMGLDDLRPVAVVRTGVLGQTGVESAEVVHALCRTLQPSAVVAVDALAARCLHRVGCTVQLCDTGIAPGSGVGNNRAALTAARLGRPVIGVGVPTVVDAATIARDLGGTEADAGAGMMVTPREVDVMVRRAARLVAMAINAALQPAYSPLDLMAAAV